MWIEKLFDVLTLGLTFYIRKETQKQINKHELDKIKLKVENLESKNEKP